MNIAARIASKKLRERRINAPRMNEDICGLMARLNPKLLRPVHLAPYISELERSLYETVECVVACPPQHGKSLTSIYGLLHFAMNKSGYKHAYSTHSMAKARSVMKEVVRHSFEAGLDPHTSNGELSLSGGTSIRFGGCVSGSLTGYEINGLHLMDDLIKDFKEALSGVILQDRWDWVLGVSETRRHPGSSSVFLATRWSEGDPSGRAIKELGYKYLRIPAICDAPDDPLGRKLGDPIWPEYRNAEWYEKYKRNVRIWSSMYQGNPRPIGDHLFSSPPSYYDCLPDSPFTPYYGVDLAYTKKTRSDWSVCLSGRVYIIDSVPYLYLTGMDRRQCQAPEFDQILKRIYDSCPGIMGWFGSGTEKGTAQYIKLKIPKFRFMNASTDKYTRAVPVSDKWNGSPPTVLLPSSGVWVNTFLEEVTGFTGESDVNDDIIDALAALDKVAFSKSILETDVAGLNAAIRIKSPDRIRF